MSTPFVHAPDNHPRKVYKRAVGRCASNYLSQSQSLLNFLFLLSFWNAGRILQFTTSSLTTLFYCTPRFTLNDTQHTHLPWTSTLRIKLPNSNYLNRTHSTQGLPSPHHCWPPFLKSSVNRLSSLTLKIPLRNYHLPQLAQHHPHHSRLARLCHWTIQK